MTLMFQIMIKIIIIIVITIIKEITMTSMFQIMTQLREEKISVYEFPSDEVEYKSRIQSSDSDNVKFKFR